MAAPQSDEVPVDDDLPDLRPRPSGWRHLGYLLAGIALTLGSLMTVVLTGGAARASPELYLLSLGGVALALYGLGGGFVALAGALVRRRTRG